MAVSKKNICKNRKSKKGVTIDSLSVFTKAVKKGLGWQILPRAIQSQYGISF